MAVFYIIFDKKQQAMGFKSFLNNTFPKMKVNRVGNKLTFVTRDSLLKAVDWVTHHAVYKDKWSKYKNGQIEVSY